MATLHSSELLLVTQTEDPRCPPWSARVGETCAERCVFTPAPRPAAGPGACAPLRSPAPSSSFFTVTAHRLLPERRRGTCHYPGRPATGIRVPRTEKRCTGEFSSKSREGRPADSPVDTNRVIQTRLSLSHSGLRERHAPTHPSSKLLARGPLYPHQNDRGPRGTFLGCILFIDILLR